MAYFRGLALSVSAACMLCAPHGNAQTSGFATIYQFPGNSGAQPFAGLATNAGADPILYGSTNLGGASDHGTIFSIAPSTAAFAWTETIVNSSTSSLNPYPHNGVAIADGVIYAAGSYGTWGGVFQFTPPSSPDGPWTPTVLYSFKGDADGAIPVGTLVVSSSHTLYGVTAEGGLCTTCGTVFQLVPPPPGSAQDTPWTFSTIYSFTGASDGSNPPAGLLMATDGSLYGVTGPSNAGPVSYGTIFRLTPPAVADGIWTETTLYTFSGNAGDGQYPSGPLSFGPNGSLIGLTSAGGIYNRYCDNSGSGCGTVFQLTPPVSPGAPWTESVLHAFAGLPGDGIYPAGTLVFASGSIYGSTEGGGSGACYAGPFRQPNGCGVVFQLAAPPAAAAGWSETLLHTFVGMTDGARPYGGVVMGSSGIIYGTTSQNGRESHGAGACCGTLFAVRP